MSSTSSIRMVLQCLGFSEYAATYLTGTCGIDSLEEIAYLDGEDDVLIPQVRPAHKYPISPWEMIHPPGGDNPVRI
jgi:hypothetical protein